MAAGLKTPHSYARKKLDPAFQDVYDAFVSYLLRCDLSELDLDVYASIAISDLKQGMAENHKAENVITKDFDKYFKKISQNSTFKEAKRNVRNEDYEKFSIASIWQVVTVFIVLLFLKNWMLETYLINYSVDILVAIVAFYLAVRNFVIKKDVMRKYNFPSYLLGFEILTIIVCVFIKLIVKNNFDITFLLLVISFLVVKRKTKPLFEKVVEG